MMMMVMGIMRMRKDEKGDDENADDKDDDDGDDDDDEDDDHVHDDDEDEKGTYDKPRCKSKHFKCTALFASFIFSVAAPSVTMHGQHRCLAMTCSHNRTTHTHSFARKKH